MNGLNFINVDINLNDDFLMKHIYENFVNKYIKCNIPQSL